jgi:hypothetical protein
MAKFKVELYNADNIRAILQQAYDLSDEQIIQAQNEINKMASATRLQDEVMDSKAKYGKIINDYLSIKDKAISKKVEIAKLMNDILNSYRNSMPGVGDATASVKQTFDLSKIKEMVKTMHEENEQTKKIELTKK